MPILLYITKFFAGGMIKFILPALSILPSILGKSVNSKTIKEYFPWVLAALAATLIIYKLSVRKVEIEVGQLNGHDGQPMRLATLLTTYLGTNKNVAWWSPTTWTEDENEVLELLQNNSAIIPEITSAYSLLSKSGSLFEDVQRTFSSSQLEKFIKIVT